MRERWDISKAITTQCKCMAVSIKLGNRHLIVEPGGLQSGVGPEEIAPTTHISSTQFTHNRMLASPVVTVNYAFGSY